MELIIASWFFYQSFRKIREIKYYDPRNPEDLTFCKLSLKIITWIRGQLVFIIFTRIVCLILTMMGDKYRDFYWTDIYDNDQSTEGDFCQISLRGKILHYIVVNGSLIYDIIGLGVVLIQIFEWIA